MKNLLIIALVALLAFISGCSKPTPLTFESLGGADLGSPYKGENALIYVISSNQTLPEAINWINTNHKTTILEVDYSKYFVVLAFNGWRGGLWSAFYIESIEQRNNNILITAHFNDPIPNAYAGMANNSEYHAVKISRDQVTQSGLITFKLLDEKGKERARTTYELNP